jgi:hypothetical protein
MSKKKVSPVHTPKAKAKVATQAVPLTVAPAAVVGLAATYAGVIMQSLAYDPTAGKAAFDALAPNRAAIATDKQSPLRIDVQAAALVAYAAYGFMTQVPALQAGFQSLDDAGLFLMTTATALETTSLAALYAFSQAETAGAFDTDAIVPPALAAQASVVEKRMQKRCEYVFADDPTVSPLLDMLRPGVGYSDLANDLLGYASIYADHKTQIASANDPNYVATDLSDAQSLAGQLLACVAASMGPTSKSANEALQQSWTLLRTTYAEVRTVGLMLLRFDPNADARFPSLTSATRAPKATSKKTPSAPPAAPPVTPVVQPTATAMAAPAVTGSAAAAPRVAGA